MKRLNKYNNCNIVLLFVIGVLIGNRCTSEQKKGNEQGDNDPRISFWRDQMIPFADDELFWVDAFEISQMNEQLFFSSYGQEIKTNVTQKEAQDICSQQGRRLCTKNEWVAACIGLSRKRFGYSNTFQKTICNTNGRGVSAAGGFGNCKNDAGVYDMVGNVMELVGDNHDGLTVAMGGAFSNSEETDCFSAHYFPKGFRSSLIGFRCCL